MITKLALENWKSYSESTLNIDPLSVLIGTNSSGKSNALDALLLLNRAAYGVYLTAALQGDASQQALRGGLEWAAMYPGSEFSLGLTCKVEDYLDFEYKVTCIVNNNSCDIKSERLARVKYRSNSKGIRTSIAGKIWLYQTDPCQPGSPTITAKLYNESRGTPRQCNRSQLILFQLIGQKLRQEIVDGVEALISAMKGIFILDPIPSHMRGYSALSEKLDPDANNIAGVLAALPRERRLELEALLTSYATQLPERDIRKVYAETVGKFNSDAMLYCEESWKTDQSNHVIDAKGMSDGTLRFLAIQTALLTRPPGSLLVIEEVDNGLHPSRAKLLLKMLRDIGANRTVDVLVTTHNPALLDAMGTEMIPFITVAHRDVKSGCSNLTLLEDLKSLPKLLAQGTIGSLSSRGLIEQSLNGEQLNFKFDA